MKTRNGLFADVPENLWNDWHWQVANRAETVEDLKKYMNLTADEEAGVAKTLGKLRMAITPYYLSLIDLNDPFDPIRKMAIPRAEELEYADRLAGPPAAQKRRRSGRKPQLHRLKPQRGQMPLHQLRRLKFAVRELRMAVNLRADAAQERVQFSALALVHRNMHRNPPRLGMFFRVLIVCRPSRFVNVCPPYFYNMACSPCQPRV